MLDAANGFGGGAPGCCQPEAAKANIGQGNVSTMQAFQGRAHPQLQRANYNCMGTNQQHRPDQRQAVRWKVKLKGDLTKQGAAIRRAAGCRGGPALPRHRRRRNPASRPQGDHDPDVQGWFRDPFAARDRRRFHHPTGTQDGKLGCINTARTLHRLVQFGGEHGPHEQCRKKRSTKPAGEVLPNLRLIRAFPQVRSTSPAGLPVSQSSRLPFIAQRICAPSAAPRYFAGSSSTASWPATSSPDTPQCWHPLRAIAALLPASEFVHRAG